MKHSLLVLGLLMLAAGSSYAQEQVPPDRGLRGVSLGAHLTTRGMGFSIDHLRGTDPNKLFIFGLAVHSVKDSREVLIESAYAEQGRRYIYGKANHLFVATPSIGIQRNMFPLHSNNAVNVRLGLQAGPAIGMLSPYLIEIFESLPGNSFYGRRSIEQFNPAEHSYNDIIGKANFLSEPLDLDLVVGMSIKGSAWIDFSRSDHYISAIQISMQADIFSQEAPIMVVGDNKQLFVAGSIGIVFGNRW
jgi:hypothetical protein